MRAAVRWCVSCVMAVVMFTCLLPVNFLPARAEALFDAASYDPGVREQVDIENESTWHALEDRPISELVHDDYVVRLRNDLVARSEEPSYTISRLDDYSAIGKYLFTEAVTVQTGDPCEGDYLRWQVPEISYDLEDHLALGYQIFNFHPEYWTDAVQEAAVDDAVNDLIDSLGIRSKTDYVKVKAVYDWMTENIELAANAEDGSHAQTAYGALLEANADSRGFALLFYRLMMELGMDTRIIHGSTPDFSSWFWNIVKLGDVYYYVDAALGVNYGNPDQWFLNGASEFIGHTADNEYLTLQFSVEYESAKNTFVPGEEDLIENDVCQGAFFDRRTMKIDECETVQLNARVLSSDFSQGLTWSSSDTGIVTVDENGSVYGVSEGTAYVFANAWAGGKVARMKVTVEKVYPDSGMAYAVKVTTDEDSNWGDLIFLRSKNNYETGEYQEVVDLWGNHYEGIVLAKGATIESSYCNYNSTSRPWSSYSNALLRIYVADSQIIHPQVLNGWFNSLSNLQAFYGGGFDLSHVSASTQLFSYCQKLEKVDFDGMYVEGEQTFSNWFENCTSLQEIDFTPLGETAVKSLWGTFQSCSSLKKLNISNLDTSNVVSMKRAFFGCKSLEEITLGPAFTSWIEDAYLPAGNWTNGTYILNETEFYEKYPQNATLWAGTWRKAHNLIPVTGISLNRNDMELRVGESETLSVEITPDDAANRNVTWSSSNTAVASVDENGKVTGIKAGTAVITAKSQDSGVTDTCTVTVTAQVIRVSSISLSAMSITMRVLETTSMTPDFIPMNATDRSVTWSSSDPSIVSVNAEGVIAANKVGTALITVKANDGNYTDSCAVVVKDLLPSPGEFTLNKYRVTLATKSSVTLSVVATPVSYGRDVIWSSSNEKIATVDKNGKVTAKTYGAVAITATSAKDKNVKDACLIETRFYDVNDNTKYYYKPVYWAADSGITKGYDSGVYFGPQLNCTRRELSIFLWRMMGKPSVTGTLPFTDTKEYKTTTDSYKAILWCYKAGIVKGYDNNTTFKPNNPITRKDTMIMLYRLNGRPNVSGTMKFKDVAAMNYAKTSDTYRSIIWGTEKGITNGYSDGNFKPLDNCLREHIVTFIYRYDQKFY